MIGIYGGAFDPVHVAHLRVAIEMLEALSLSEVRFVPTGQPKHREGPVATAEQRLAMLELAVRGIPRLTVDDRELRRDRASYTIDTLAELASEVDESLCLIVGADAFSYLASWRKWRSLFDYAHLAVAPRPGINVAALQSDPDLASFLWVEQGEGRPIGSWSLVDATELDISSSDIRRRRESGQSIRFLVADAVHDYLFDHSLYAS